VNYHAEVTVNSGRGPEFMQRMSSFFASSRAGDAIRDAETVAEMQSEYTTILGLLAEPTETCPKCGGEQEIGETHAWSGVGFEWHLDVHLACGHINTWTYLY
jgi:hypothetical protein